MSHMFFSVVVMKEVVNALWNIANILRGEMNMYRTYPILGYIACMKRLRVSSVEELTKILHNDCAWKSLVMIPNAPFLSIVTTKRMVDNLCQLKIESNSRLSDALDDFFHRFTADAPLLEAFDHILQSAGQREGILLPSKELVKLGYMLLGNKPGRVLDPFAGVGGFATSNDFYLEFHGAELSELMTELGEIRLFLGNVSESASYLPDEESFKKDRYTSMITMPPFRMKMSSPLDHTDTMSDLVPFQIYMDEEDFVEEKMVCFLPMAFLSESRTETVNIRKQATEGHYIDTVILLPSGLLYNTGIAICAVLMSTDMHDSVHIIDARNAFVKNDIKTKTLDIDAVEGMLKEASEYCFNLSFEEIANNGYSWFMSKELKSEQTKKYPANYIVREFSELAANIVGEPDSSVKMAHVASFQSLSKNLANCLQDAESFPLIDCTGRRYRKITEPVLLLSNRSELRPTYCNASSETPIYVDIASVMCYRVSPKVHVGYLIKELSSCYLMTDETPISRIYRSYVEHLKIGLPSPENQNSIFEESVRFEKLAQAREIGLQNVIESMKAEYISEVRARKHDMKTPMAQLRNSLTLIKELVAELPDKFASRLDKYVSRQQKAMDVLSDIVSHIADEDVFATPEIINIESVLRSFETITDRYVIEYHRDNISLNEAGIEIPYLKIGKVDFVRLVQNIVSNAVKRGFVKDNAEYTLNISLSVENDFFVIDFSNNGEPLPDGMDKQRYGTKGAKGVNSDGSGTGGYIVKSITQHYGGDFDIFSSKFANMDFTNVIVKLPIYRKEDE